MPYSDFDVFAYSEGNLATVSAAKWTKLSGFADIVQAGSNATGVAATTCAAVITDFSGGSETVQYSAVFIIATGDEGGPTVMSDEFDTFYALLMTLTDWTVEKCVAGVFTLLDTVPQVMETSTYCYLENKAGMLVSKWGFDVVNPGNPVNVLMDLSIPSGKPGMLLDDTAIAIALWRAGDPTAPRVDASADFFPKAMLSTLDHEPDGLPPSDIS